MIPGPGEFHLWRFQLSASESHQSGREVVRPLLGSYLKQDPECINLTSGDFGKPHLIRGEGPDLRFNLAHDGDCMLVIVATGCEVGVDLQSVDPSFPVELLSSRVLSVSERPRFSRLAQADRLEFLVRIWTRKEAILKAMGVGLSVEPASITLIENDPGLPQFALVESDLSKRHRWLVSDVVPDPWPGLMASYAWEVLFSDPSLTVSTWVGGMDEPEAALG